MISTVSGPQVGLSQLITRRKVGRPGKERASAPSIISRKSPHDSEEDKVEENLVFYAANPSGGLTLNRYTPTGQYLDTYA